MGQDDDDDSISLSSDSIGWFDAFRDHGAPTWYGDNRTPVVIDTGIAAIVAVFAIFMIAFLIILPGVRRQRWSSFISIVFSMSVGAVLLVCIYYPCWHKGHVHINSTYRAFSVDRMDALLGVRIGLKHVNITLSAVDQSTNDTDHQLHAHHLLHDLNYNERFYFTEVKTMERELYNALRKGLPYPILKVVEYLSVDRAGFVWGRQYRLAGYYACFLLWLAFACWTLQIVMLCLVPQYFARTASAVGICALLADLVYVLNCPTQLKIRFPGPESQPMSLLDFRLGWCFYATLCAGVTSLIFGAVLDLLQVKALYSLTTFLQADFDEVIASPIRCSDDSQQMIDVRTTAMMHHHESAESLSMEMASSSGRGSARASSPSSTSSQHQHHQHRRKTPPLMLSKV